MNLLKAIVMTTALIGTPMFFRTEAQESQYRWNVGAHIGMAGYFGDYNGSNPFSSPGFCAGVTGAYSYDVRWEFVADASFMTLNGSTKNIAGAYPTTLNDSFSATLASLDVKTQFNFFPYGIGETYKGLRNWTPYLTAGIGVVGAKPRDSHFVVAPEIPMGFGFKYKPSKRLNLYAEVCFTKTFTDGIDGASDIYGIKSSWFKNTDWTTSVSVGFTYEFGERCLTCHYVD